MARFQRIKFATDFTHSLPSALISKSSALTVLAFAVGAVAWSGHAWTIPLGLIVFKLLTLAERRTQAFRISTAYYAGSTWPLLPGASAFFGPHASLFDSVLVWTIASLLLSFPLWTLWSKDEAHRAWSMPLAIIITAIPPLGVFNVASPLTSAGILFPGFSWYGIFATLLLISVLSDLKFQPYPALYYLVALIVLVANLTTLTFHQPKPPDNWLAVSTEFGGAGLNAPTAMELYHNEQLIRTTFRESNATVVIFPESAVYRWTRVTDMFWRSDLDNLRADGRTILVGAGIPQLGHKYLNAIFIRGQNEQQPFLQRIPVPLGMWRPFQPDSVPMRPFGPGTIQIGDERVAPIICYEQLLVWPILSSEIARPTVILGLSNEYWAKNTSIPNIQHAALYAWSRLFATPMLTAVNQ